MERTKIPSVKNGHLTGANAGWLFYKHQFEGKMQGEAAADFKLMINPNPSPEDKKALDSFFSNKNKLLTKPDISWSPAFRTGGKPTAHKGPYYLKTTYPGLLIGSGYTHETGSLGEFKLGFFFDHTTGMPVIPGSSIKGTVRSVFPQWDNKAIRHKTSKTRYIWQCLHEISEEHFNMPEDETDDYWGDHTKPEVILVHHLELVLFEGKNPRYLEASEGERESLFRHLSYYKRDIFHDAAITEQVSGELFGNDFITPHKHPTDPSLDPFTNPTPIQFLKIMPEVPFTFTFDFEDSTFLVKDQSYTISAETKQKLCIEIIKTIGLGAKTNVGYGQFVDETVHNPQTSIVVKPQKIPLYRVSDNPHKAVVTFVSPNTKKGDFNFNMENTEFSGRMKLSKLPKGFIVKEGDIIEINLNHDYYGEPNEEILFKNDVKKL